MKWLIIAIIALGLNCQVLAGPRHGIIAIPDGSSFNGGKFQVNLNLPGIGGDYPFLNQVKNSSGNWSLRDNTGSPAPSDLDANGYPLNGSDAIVNHQGVSVSIRVPAQAYTGNNCLAGTSGTGTCVAILVNGKGTIADPGTIITSSPATATVTTGSVTSITFNQAQDFRAGMEVPLSGTTGVTATNGGGGPLVNGGTTGAWTVCAAGLTPTTIRLCLNDQITALTTTGTAGGTTVAFYGRNAVGVAANGRIVSSIAASPPSVSIGISAQDATTPITYRNGTDGLAMVTQGSEEIRYAAGQTFSAAFKAKLASGNPGVIRSLNTLNSNSILDVHWADRMPVSYFSYGSDQYDRRGGTVYAGTTTSAGNDYSATLGTGAPVDGQQISLLFDAASVSVTNGANALITWTGHGFVTGSAFVFGFSAGGAAPGGVATPSLGINLPNNTYYAITTCGSCDANHIQFATSIANALAGTPVTTSSTGTNVLAHATVAPATVTLTSGNTSIAWPNHLLNINDSVSFTAIAALNAPLNNGSSFYVKSVPDSGHITVAATPGGAALAPLQSGAVGAVRNPTLSLNGTTAISIKDSQGFGVGTVKSTEPIARIFGSQFVYATLTYDAVIGAWVKYGGDTSAGTQLFKSGWPPEIVLKLCIEMGAHCWFSPPVFTVDGSAGITDYNTGLYTYVHANAPGWMIPRFEVLPNEFWNNQFPATTIMSAHAAVYNSTAGWSANSGVMQVAGKIASVLGQALHNEYNATLDSTKYQAIVGVQTFNFSTSGGPSSNAPRLTSTDYIAQSTSPQSPYTKSAASNWTTHIACAQYFTPGYYGSTIGTTLASANAGGVITGSINGTTLSVSSVRVVTSPVFGVGSILTQGPGITGPVTVLSSLGGGNWQLDTTFTTPVGNTDIDYNASGYDVTAVKTFVDSVNHDATFTASISGTTMTVTGTTGFILDSHGNGGDVILGSGVADFTQVVTAAIGNQNGTYTITPSQTVASTAMTANGVFSLPAENVMYTKIFAFAQTPAYANRDGFLKRMTGYEGGYSPDYTNGAAWTLTDQLAGSGKLVISSPGSATGIYGYVLTNAQNFKAAGGEFPSLFQFTGITPTTDAWSALDDIYQPAPTPIWNAYRDYNFLLKGDFRRSLPPSSNDNDPMFLEKAA